MKAYHFCRLTDRGEVVDRNGRVIPEGAVERWDGPLELCESGLHASEHPLDALNYAPGPILRLVECGGELVQGDDKVCCRERREVARLDMTDVLRVFAIDCAIRVLPIWEKKYPDDLRPREAIEAAKEYLEGKATIEEVSAAAAAAWAAAAWAAEAWAAARSAAAAARAEETQWQRNHFRLMVDAAFKQVAE